MLAKIEATLCDFIGLQETRKSGKTEFSAARYRPVCSGQFQTEGRQALYEVGLVVKESKCRKSVFVYQLVDKRLMSMRFELTSECAAVNLVVAYAPMEADPNAELKEVFWKKLGHLVKQIATKELLFLLIDANARTRKRMEGCNDGRVLGAYGRDELNINGKRLLSLASDIQLALTNTIFSARRGGVSHSFNGINSRNDRKQIDYILTRQAHRPPIYDVKVHPQPSSPAKTDSDHNMVYAMARFSGRIAPNRRIGTRKHIQLFDSLKFRSDGDLQGVFFFVLFFYPPVHG